jgi:hypothetical protein
LKNLYLGQEERDTVDNLCDDGFDFGLAEDRTLEVVSSVNMKADL